jgi:hypothetical protein
MADQAKTLRGLFIREAAFHAFDDRAILRDPAGRTRRPHLVPMRRDDERGLLARGPFSLHVRYRVGKPEGIDFCRATGDDNSIHFEGDIVPGAYTAAKAILPVEVLFPDLEITSCSMKFTAIANYDRALFTKMHVVPTEDGGASFEASVTQEGAPIAEIEVATKRFDPANAGAEIVRRKVNVDRLKAVRSFIRSLHVAPHAYFRSAAHSGYYYPRSFLASLPSGAMVRQFRGEGGLLNKLTLEFDGFRVPITGSEDPTVAIERPKARRTFNKILAAIGDGLRTYVRGTALVLSREGAAAAAAALPQLPAPAALPVPVPVDPRR